MKEGEGGEVITNPKEKQIYKKKKTHLQFFFIYKLNKYPPFDYPPNLLLKQGCRLFSGTRK